VKKNNWVNSPNLRFLAVIESIDFIGCYITVAFYYPGGSDFNVHSNHFSIKETTGVNFLAITLKTVS